MASEVVADRYELRDRLGAGGVSDVFAGYDRRLRRSVAVKVLRAGIRDSRARARFEREARIAANFNHPNAVAIYDVGEHDSAPFLVLELVDGPSLAHLIASRGRLDPDEAVAIVDQVLDALGAAHAQGLVHRDVKPSNILLTSEHVAKLSDFGIAKAVADATGGVTMTGELIGTPRYLSPEQVAGRPATSRSDQYAVGVVLYEALAGAPPFVGETPIATALAHRQQPLPSLGARRPDLPPALVAAVERALDKDPTRRYADAGEMRRALANVDAGTATATLPHLVTPPRRAEPARPPVTARAWIIGALVALCLALVGGALLLSDDSGDNSAGGAPTSVSTTPTTTPPTAPPSTTSTPTTSPPRTSTTVGITLPRTISELVALLASNPTTYGSRAKDLLKSLQQVQAHAGNKEAAKQRQKAIDDVREWIADRSLDATIGNLAVSLLEASSTEPTTRSGRD